MQLPVVSIDLVPLGSINIKWSSINQSLLDRGVRLVLSADEANVIAMVKAHERVIPLLITVGTESLSKEQQGVAKTMQSHMLPYIFASATRGDSITEVYMVVGKNQHKLPTLKEAIFLCQFLNQVSLDTAASQSSNFLEGVSHEVRSFLNGISGPIQLLKDKIEAKDQYDLYSMIDSSIARLVRFTFKTSLIGLMQREDYKVKQEVVNLYTLIQHTVVDLQEIKFSGKVDVDIAKPLFEPTITGDADLLIQCFQSLMERIVLSYGNDNPLQILFEKVEEKKFVCKIIFAILRTGDNEEGIKQQLIHDFNSDLGFILAKQIMDIHQIDFSYAIVDHKQVEFNLVFKPVLE
jgi:hypothetical protein